MLQALRSLPAADALRALDQVSRINPLDAAFPYSLYQTCRCLPLIPRCGKVLA